MFHLSILKYIYDQENDKFNFYLVGNTRSFKISFVDIKMLLTGKISTENLPNINTNNKRADCCKTFRP